jgi:hypothetical protein
MFMQSILVNRYIIFGRLAPIDQVQLLGHNIIGLCKQHTYYNPNYQVHKIV